MHDDADPALFRVAHSLLQAELVQQRRLVIRDRDGDDHRRAAGAPAGAAAPGPLAPPAPGRARPAPAGPSRATPSSPRTGASACLR